MQSYPDISVLVGKTLESVEQHENSEVVFRATDGTSYRLFHMQDCCESVTIDDVCGEWSSLVGSPILMAEEVSGEIPSMHMKGKYYPESETWTFYKFATVKGYVTMRWYGESNGYYSESVNFVQLT